LKFLMDSFDMRKRIHKSEHKDLADSLNNIGNVYSDKGDYDMALKFLMDSFDMRKRIYKSGHPDIASVLENIGIAYRAKRDYVSSLKYLNESLDIMKIFFKSNDHPRVAKILRNIIQTTNNM
jgi:tetratricopeptide (TPR) repeat protein